MTFPYWAGPPAGPSDHGSVSRPRSRGGGSPRPPSSPVAADPAVDPDRRLLDGIHQGDVGALTTLFDAYMPAMVRFVRGMVHDDDIAQDIVQETFVALWEGRESVHPKTTIRAYLFVSARGRALHVIRRDRLEERYAQRQGDIDTSTPETPRRPDQQVEDREIFAAVHAAMQSLSPRVRQAAELRWYGAMSYAEIAQTLGVSERTINNHLTAAAKQLRHVLEPHRSEID